MHVLLIHQAFAGPGDAGGTRHYELSRYLAARGHQVTIVASELNYLTGTKADAVGDALAPGIDIIRVPVRGALHDSYATRVRSFVSFVAAATRAALRVADVDVVWGTTPPLPQLLPAWLASLRSRGGLVMEERDLWPEFAIGMGLIQDGALARAAMRFKKLMYGRAARVIINSPGFVPFLESYGVDSAKVRVIPNGVDVGEFAGGDGSTIRRELGLGDEFVVLYAGALGPANGLDVVLTAAEQLRDTPAVFLLVGDGKARAELMRAADERGLANVRFVAAQPKARIPSFVAASDACLATLRPIPLFRTTYPNKVFDYMAGARPVLLGIDGVIRDVVDEARAGIFTTPGDAAALATAVRHLLGDRGEARAMGERGRIAVRERFDRGLQGAQLEALFEELLPQTRTRPAVMAKAAKVA